MGGDFLVNPKIYFEHMARVMYEYFIYTNKLALFIKLTAND